MSRTLQSLYCSLQILEAKEVYLLMHDDYYISRNVRTLWYFDHLNRIISTVKPSVPHQVSVSVSFTVFGIIKQK